MNAFTAVGCSESSTDERAKSAGTEENGAEADATAPAGEDGDEPGDAGDGAPADAPQASDAPRQSPAQSGTELDTPESDAGSSGPNAAHDATTTSGEAQVESTDGSTNTETVPVCGNGVLEPGETCDSLESCVASCNDGNACSSDTLLGAAETCDVACAFPINTTCVDSDLCCPDGCDATVDSDCSASCGNGTLEPGETCDPPGSCPNSCDDHNACTVDAETGGAVNCNMACSHTEIVSCVSGDGCCAAGCTTSTDDDCSAACGNDFTDPGETCDPPGSCPSSCDDGNACTTDITTGSAANCNVACSRNPVSTCIDGDGCCPIGCTSLADGDCSETCGNSVVEAGELCDPPGGCPSSCDDLDACTTDTATGSAANCNFACSYNDVTACVDGDGCCPGGCNIGNDDDCPISCGDSFVSVAEQCDPPNGVSCNANCEIIATQLVGGAGLTLQDASSDGLYVAYTDNAKTLYSVATNGGSPVMLTTNADAASYYGKYLVAFKAIDEVTGKTAASMLVYPETAASPTITAQYPVIDSLVASADGEHIAYYVKQSAGASTEDIHLDGTLILAGAQKERINFSPANNNVLVVGARYTDSNSAVVDRVLAFAPGVAAPVTLVASGAARRFQFTPDGAYVVVGTNESAGVTDLSKVPIVGGAGVALATGVNDKLFRTLEDNATLAYVVAATGELNVVGLDGAVSTTLVASGVVDLVDDSADAVVYATAVDAITGYSTLRWVGVAGSSRALGMTADPEGFTSNGRYYALRDNVSNSAGGLTRMDTTLGTLSPIRASVTKATFVDDARMLHLDTSGALRLADLSTATSTELQTNIAQFRKVRDALGNTTSSRVAFVLASGEQAGLYLESF